MAMSIGIEMPEAKGSPPLIESGVIILNEITEVATAGKSPRKRQRRSTTVSAEGVFENVKDETGKEEVKARKKAKQQQASEVEEATLDLGATRSTDQAPQTAQKVEEIRSAEGGLETGSQLPSPAASPKAIERPPSLSRSGTAELHHENGRHSRVAVSTVTENGKNSRGSLKAMEASRTGPSTTPPTVASAPPAEEVRDGGKDTAGRKRKRRFPRGKKYAGVTVDGGAQVDEKTRIKRRVKSLVSRIRLEQNLIDAYANDGWKGNNREKIRPEKELQRAEMQIVSCKLAIRDLIHDLDTLRLDGSLKQSAFDEDGQIFHEEIFCAKCKSEEVFVDNDIILCDGACDRAFHQECVDPPLATADIPPGDEGWLCPVCDSKVECLNYINGYLGTEFEVEDQWENFFPEAATLNRGLSNVMGEDWPSEDSDDEEYDPLRNVHQDGDQEEQGEDRPSEDSDDEEDDPRRKAHRDGDEEKQGEDWPSEDSDDEEYDPRRKTHQDGDEEQQGEEWPSEDSDDEEYDPRKKAHQDGEEQGGDFNVLKASCADSSLAFKSESEASSASYSCNDDDSSSSEVSAGELPDHGRSSKRPDRGSRTGLNRGNMYHNPKTPTATEADEPEDIGLVSGKRHRNPVDYKKLHTEMFGDDSDDAGVLSEDEEWGPGEMGRPGPEDISLASGRRHRKPVDYKRLHAEMFGEESVDAGVLSEDEEWGPGKMGRRGGETEGPSGVSKRACDGSGWREEDHRVRKKQSPVGRQSDDVKEHDLSQGNHFSGRKIFKGLPDSAVMTLREEFETGTRFPSRTYKEALAERLGISFQQVSSWFKNARRVGRRRMGQSNPALVEKKKEADAPSYENLIGVKGRVGEIERTNGLLIEKLDEVRLKFVYLKQSLEAII